VFISLSNIPIAYMTALEGERMRNGGRGLLYIEVALGMLSLLVFGAAPAPTARRASSGERGHQYLNVVLSDATAS